MLHASPGEHCIGVGAEPPGASVNRASACAGLLFADMLEDFRINCVLTAFTGPMVVRPKPLTEAFPEKKKPGASTPSEAPQPEASSSEVPYASKEIIA